MAGRRGPYQKAMTFFPLDVNIFDDPKLWPVQEQYGPLGEAVYLRLLCMIYKSGYYLQFDSLDNLAAQVVRAIGSKWIRGIKSAKQVISLLVDCGLFDSELAAQGILTSAGIQSRYLRAFARKQIDTRYWLLPAAMEAAPGVVASRENVSSLGESVSSLGKNVYNFSENAANKIEVESKVYSSSSNNPCDTGAENGENAVPDMADTEGFYRYYFGAAPTAAQLTQCRRLIAGNDAAIVRYAFDRMAETGKTTLAYARGVIRNLRQMGIVEGQGLAAYRGEE